jgi:lipoprotein-anchoring transpeptidase ErfK/SrfK
VETVAMAERMAVRRAWQGLAMLVCAASIAGCSREPPAPAPGSAAAAAAAPAAKAPAPVFAVHTILEPDRAITAGDYVWNAEGAPNAPLQIVIDIEAQRLYAYRGGVEIGRSSLIYGADDKPTPTGIFPILEKDADHVSNIYDAPMPYMLRLTWDGIAIHASEVDDWSATNGCIGLPEEFAELLFAQARLGDKVLVTNGWLRETYGDEA